MKLLSMYVHFFMMSQKINEQNNFSRQKHEQDVKK